MAQTAPAPAMPAAKSSRCAFTRLFYRENLPMMILSLLVAVGAAVFVPLPADAAAD